MTTVDEPEAPAFDPDALREKYRAERDKRLRPDGNEQYVEIAGRVRPLPRGPLRRADRARPAVRRGRRRRHRRRLRRPARRRPPQGGRDHRRPHHREGRRLRRHVVLEPLPGRAVRHRVVHLPAAARGDRLHPEGEVHAGARDPRAQPQHRRALRPLRRRAVPDRGHDADVGRRVVALARRDEPRRRAAGPLRLHGERPAAPPEAARHPRRRGLPGPLVPHQPLGLRLHGRRLRGEPHEARRQARRHHRHRRHRGAGACPTSAPPPSSSTCSSARRRRSTCATTARPTRSGRRRSSPGWQQRRMENFNNLVSGIPEPEDLVGDGWTDIIGKLLLRMRQADGADGVAGVAWPRPSSSPTSTRWSRSGPASTRSSTTRTRPRR